VQSDVVDLAHGVGHEQVPALYDQSLGKFYFRAGTPAVAAAGAGPAMPAAAGVHVPSAAELDESYWQGIKGSSDPSDFTGYTKSFPKGMHVAEAEMLNRKLTRSATAKAAASPASAPASAPPSTPAAAPAFAAKPGSYRGFITSSLIPGQEFPGTWTINKDGSIDSMNDYGDRAHATIDSSDQNGFTTMAISHLGVFNGIQRRYPDGSTSTQVISQGRLLNGVISGTWHDKFQAGQFQVTVGK